MASVGRVNFTLRQWAVIAGLAAAFIVAAVLVGDSGAGDGFLLDKMSTENSTECTIDSYFIHYIRVPYCGKYLLC